MTLVPSYGKDYKSIKEVKEAFNANKDFLIASCGFGAGQYVNRKQLVGIERSVMIRYAKLTKEVEVEVKS